MEKLVHLQTTGLIQSTSLKSRRSSSHFLVGPVIVASLLLLQVRNASARSPLMNKPNANQNLNRALPVFSSALVGRSEGTCFSPQTKCDDKLVQLIRSASRTLEIAVFDITNDSITNSIIDQSKHINVRVIVDRRQSKGRSSTVSALVQAGVDVRLGSQRGIMHNKFTIADLAVMETGSYNYTNNATKNNNENQIYLTSQTLIADYETYFNDMWSHAIPIDSADALLIERFATDEQMALPQEHLHSPEHDMRGSYPSCSQNLRRGTICVMP